MPPLLPEYLSQPVQLVAQSTSGWQVWVGAGATLLGAAIGAALGGWVAYRATDRANRSNIRRHKLEEALMIIGEIEHLFRPMVSYLDIDPFNFDDTPAAEKVKMSVRKIDKNNSARLVTLLKIYKPDMYENSVVMHESLISICENASSLDTIHRQILNDFVTEPLLQYRELANQVSDNILQELR